MQVYLISTKSGCMVGIETLRIVTVPASKEAAFKKQYANQIFASGKYVKPLAASLGLPYKPSGV
jgi:hypothetical protein